MSYLQDHYDTMWDDGCPFDTRLARTPYLVLPKLAIQSMPLEWRKRLDALLKEADEAGLETPEYLVFRDLTRLDGDAIGIRGCRHVNREVYHERPFYRLTGGHRDDPWVDYRRGNIKDLCPGFAPPLPIQD